MEPETKVERLIPIPLRDNDTKEILWRLYADNYQNARHNETQRSAVTNFIILIAGGIVTIVSSGGFTRSDLPLTGMLIGLGVFGALFSASHYERYKRSKERAKAYLRELDYILFGSEKEAFRRIKIMSDNQRKREHPRLDKLYDVHWLWLFLPMMITLLGLILTGLCMVKVAEPSPTKVLLVDQNGKPR